MVVVVVCVYLYKQSPSQSFHFCLFLCMFISLTHFCLFVYLYRMFVFTHVGGRDKRLNSLLFSCFVLYFWGMDFHCTQRSLQHTLVEQKFLVILGSYYFCLKSNEIIDTWCHVWLCFFTTDRDSKSSLLCLSDMLQTEPPPQPVKCFI